jgi:hypothetical protein
MAVRPHYHFAAATLADLQRDARDTFSGGKVTAAAVPLWVRSLTRRR